MENKNMRIIQIILGIISLFFGLFALVFILILPLMGIHFDYNTNGSSMNPTLTNAVDIRLSPERAPYEDLQVGDIIVFKQWDHAANNMPPGPAYNPEMNEDHNQLEFVRQTELEEQKKYILVRHRIIEISEKGLVTKGDNSEWPDFLSVKPEEYQGKIVWHMNHINWLFKAMYRYGLWSGSLVLFIIVSTIYGIGKKSTNEQSFEAFRSQH